MRKLNLLLLEEVTAVFFVLLVDFFVAKGLLSELVFIVVVLLICNRVESVRAVVLRLLLLLLFLKSFRLRLRLLEIFCFAEDIILHMVVSGVLEFFSGRGLLRVSLPVSSAECRQVLLHVVQREILA